MDDNDPRDLLLPREWRQWPLEGRVQYVESNLNRDEVMVAIVAEVNLSDIDPADVTPTTRLSKRQLTEIGLAVGLWSGR